MDGDVDASGLLKRGEDGGAGVGFGRVWDDACGREELVAGEGLEKSHGLVEEIYHLLLWNVVGVAARFQSADAGSVLAPFVLPEGLIRCSLVFPVGIHVVEEVGGASRGKDGADVGIRTRSVAVGVVGAIAVVWPETVNGPGICRALGRATVPELSLRLFSLALKRTSLLLVLIHIPAEAGHLGH